MTNTTPADANTAPTVVKYEDGMSDGGWTIESIYLDDPDFWDKVEFHLLTLTRESQQVVDRLNGPIGFYVHPEHGVLFGRRDGEGPVVVCNRTLLSRSPR